MSAVTRTKWAVAVGMAILLGGSLTLASNMGFKANIEINDEGLSEPDGNHWVSVPVNNPYPDAATVCTQWGLPNGALVARFNPALVGGGFVNKFCGTGGTGFTLVPYEALKIRKPVGPVVNAIVVGSHDPTATLTINDEGTSEPDGNHWVSVPYHTTAVNAAELCVDAGLPNGALVARFNPALVGGGFVNKFCGTAGPGFTLVIGEGVKIRKPVGPAINYLPSHY